MSQTYFPLCFPSPSKRFSLLLKRRRHHIETLRNATSDINTYSITLDTLFAVCLPYIRQFHGFAAYLRLHHAITTDAISLSFPFVNVYLF